METNAKADEERARLQRRTALKQLNTANANGAGKSLDSSLKRHTALIKRMRQSIGADNRDTILKDVEQLALEKYIEEIAGAIPEGIARCKTDKDAWAATEVISALHRRFPATFTPAIISSLGAALAPTPKAALAAMSPEQREKEEQARVTRQRPVLRVCSELALVGIIRDAPGRAGGEWIMRALRELLSGDPSLSSLPLLTTFLKSYARPYLGLNPPASTNKQVSADVQPGALSAEAASDFPELGGAAKEEEELVEKEIRERFKKMCEGYFDNVAKKLVIEHKRLQEQDRRNHEAYIRSGEIFEDRQQAYEKMTKSYEKLHASCQTLSELLYMPMPSLPTSSSTSASIQIGTDAGGNLRDEDEIVVGGKWEDEEERRFFEDLQDLREMVPRSVLGIEEEDLKESVELTPEEKAKMEEEEVRKLEEELAKLAESPEQPNTEESEKVESEDEEEDGAATPVPGTPKEASPSGTPVLAPQGPSQMLTALLGRLPDCTNRNMIDQAATEFAFLNSKAARKRLVKFLTQVPKNRTDVLPHYSRLVATLSKYMPDIGTELVAALDEEFRYLQRKKNVVKELADTRRKNITFIANLTKFRVVPPHVILHIFKVCLDDFTGTNVDNIAMLLEGCGRFLLRHDETSARFGAMLALMKRKQSLMHFDQRQVLMLENAYYQANPPERAPRTEKHRPPLELFARHLLYDVLSKRTLDKVLKLLRKLDWNDQAVVRLLHKMFTKPHKLKFGNIALLAMLCYDLQRYHPEFSIGVVDTVFEDVRRGLEQNIYSANQRRVATIKYLGELYIYRLIGSALVFDTLWSLVTFGHPEGHPLPQYPCTIDMPDDFFRVRLVCTLLDTCAMCFDRGSQRKKLENFVVFFHYYILCKEPLPMDVDFMLSDSLEALKTKVAQPKTLEEAASAVDAMFATAFQNAGLKTSEDAEDSDSGDEDEERPTTLDEEDEEDAGAETSPIDRGPSPEPELVLKPQENLGPDEEAEAEFAREFARMVSDTSTDARKVDRRTAQALWENAVLPSVARPRQDAQADEGTMSFTVLTRRGNPKSARTLAVPAESALAVQTREARTREQVEHQQLKRLVLDYEQREEQEERERAVVEAQARARPVKIRIAG
ncbi:unnamed protein product [Peniophora sp. CBMAI 1063]|nr:unnamed protein product [Peniophora sp. CBMAI 1063]